MAAASAEKVSRFRALHRRGAAFVFPNFWDAGSARILEGLGFPALASTSSGFALTKGRADYGVTRDEVMEHARAICAAVEIPVAADLENGFGPAPEDCAATIRLASAAGLCGGSIEDSTGDKQSPIHEKSAAVARVRAAVEAARAAPQGFLLTARAEAFLYGDADLKDVISRLEAFEDAGADVLFAPGLPSLDAVRAVCAAVSKPVNVLVYGALARHSVAEFADAGVARLSLGGGLANAAYGALAEIAAAIREGGTFDALASHRAGVRTFKNLIGD
ncbi:MAG: isocitrate lyase/phosphoenolpyruvate mutase family protein [Parvularculaceae bacterium]|nr:isocitrate lyase/phosphoenolpyruvate mutase family protein [Parvularculaceae bacterium]